MQKSLKELIEMKAATHSELAPYIRSGANRKWNDFLEMYGYTDAITEDDTKWEFMPEDGLWYIKF